MDGSDRLAGGESPVERLKPERRMPEDVPLDELSKMKHVVVSRCAADINRVLQEHGCKIVAEVVISDGRVSSRTLIEYVG